MRFDIITIFPSLFDFYLKESLIKKACQKKILEINIHNLRDYSNDPHQSVDDKPFGGGSGMVMKLEPIYNAVKKIKRDDLSSKVVLFTPRGKKFNQKKASYFAKNEQIIMICGRYEGIDERVLKYIADENISMGNYVLMGGEIPAMAVIETVSRLIPGVIGKTNFLEERKEEESFIEYPQYTRPEIFNKEEKKWKVPPVLISGDHKKIEQWKKKKRKTIK